LPYPCKTRELTLAWQQTLQGHGDDATGKQTRLRGTAEKQAELRLRMLVEKRFEPSQV
jgi:hypothetical protein